MPPHPPLLFVLFAAALVGCGGTDASMDQPGPADGELAVLTYNVAGLPSGISSGDPAQNMVRISPLLNAYELVLVQEDFAFHHELVGDLEHPHTTEGIEPENNDRAFDDGLNRFSVHPFQDHQRWYWGACNGTLDGASDCLAEKGFSWAVHEVSPGVKVHVVNLHAEAGGGELDEAARAVGFETLIEVLAEISPDQALIVAGDTNTRRTDPPDAALLADFEARTGLADVYETLAIAEEELIDRVFLRSSAEVELTPIVWQVAEEFVDDQGQPLSDHLAVHVQVGWSTGAIR